MEEMAGMRYPCALCTLSENHMDSLTQAALGAAIQGVGMGRQQGRKALLYGAALGTLPDLDVLIRYADPVSSMTYHRGVTHSVFVLIAAAALIAWGVKKRWPDAPYSGRRLFFTTAASLITHPILDAFTVYGTQLLWPFTPTPQQWSGIFIIDPLYTLPLLIAIGITLWRSMQAKAALTLALVWGSVYLAFGTYGQYHHEQRILADLHARNIPVTRVMATPTPFNTLLYRVIAQTPDGDYLETMSGWLDTSPPEYRREPQGLEQAAVLVGDPLYERLYWFADGWLRVDREGDKLVVSDMRMGMTGSFTFRFVMAQAHAGAWQRVTPYVHERNMRDLSRFFIPLWHRIWNSHAPGWHSGMPVLQ